MPGAALPTPEPTPTAEPVGLDPTQFDCVAFKNKELQDSFFVELGDVFTAEQGGWLDLEPAPDGFICGCQRPGLITGYALLPNESPEPERTYGNATVLEASGGGRVCWHSHSTASPEPSSDDLAVAAGLAQDDWRAFAVVVPDTRAIGFYRAADGQAFAAFVGWPE